MVTEKPLPEKSALEKEINRLLEDLSNLDAHSVEYNATSDQLTKLYKLKEIDAPKRVSPDTLLLVVSNIAGILAILGYERFHIITSKALSFVTKLR